MNQLGRWCKKASKLYNTNIWPAASYGIAAYGAPPGVVRQLRSDAAICTSSKSGACTTTSIAIGLPHGSDPAVALRVEVMRCWIDFWASNPHLHEKLSRTWMKLVPKLASKVTRWRQVGGPVGAAVATLYDLGWRPVAPNGWISPDGTPEGQIWEFKGYGDCSELYRTMAKSAMQVHWAHAATRWSGSGAAGGVDASLLKRHLRKLEKDGRNDTVGLLTSIATGATWPRQRKFEAGLAEDALCPRCGEAAETDLHRFWTCPKNLEMVDPAVCTSNSLICQAILDNNANSIFWCRGLVPAEWVDTGPPPKDTRRKLVGDGSLWRPGIFFTDGSGGDKGSDPRLRRCGWGAVRLDLDDPGNPKIACGAYGPLPGRWQTVPRSELYAAIQVLDLVRTGNVVIFSDCSYFVDHAGLAEKRNCMCLGSNGDLWTRWWALIDERNKVVDPLGAPLWTVVVKKVKAHSEYADLCSGAITLENFKGNALADYLAGKGAELGRLDSNIIATVEFIDGRAWKIQKRLLAILKSIYASSPEAEPKRTMPPIRHPKPIPIPPLVRLAELGHEPVRDGNMWRCMVCAQGCHNSNLKAWCEKGRCVALRLRVIHGMQELGPVAPIPEDPAPLGFVSFSPVIQPPPAVVFGPRDCECCPRPATSLSAVVVRVGRQALHHTHTIMFKRGVYWCQRCGCFCMTRARLMAKRCNTRPSKESQTVLRRIGRGDTPKAGQPWPMMPDPRTPEGLVCSYTEWIEPLRDG